MPNDEEEYWEQEYAEFEKSFCSGKVFWRAPAYAIRETALFSLFERLCELFPDHPDDHNTVFYLFDHVNTTPQMYSVVLRCSHFEHDRLDDLRSLIEFLEYAGDVITAGGSGSLEPCLDLLDATSETLHVVFYEPRDEIVRLLQGRASRHATLP